MLHKHSTLTLLFIALVLGIAPSFANNNPENPECACPPVWVFGNVQVTSTVTSVTISWTTPPPPTPPAAPIFSSYNVEILEGTTVHFKASTATGSVVINGTSPSTNYIAKVYGICADGQTATATMVNFVTVAGTTNCGSGPKDLGSNDQNDPSPFPDNGTSVQDQIENPNDIDWFSFYVPCAGIVTVRLNSLSNDYDLTVVPPNGPAHQSFNPGMENEFISFTIAAPGEVKIQVHGFGLAYNTYDCYMLAYTAPLPCFTGGGGGENMTSDNGSGTNGTPVISDGNFTLHFDSAFQRDEQVDLQVFSADGRVVLSESTQVFKGENQIKVDLPSMSAGIYLVNVTGAFGAKSQKIVIAR